MRLGLIRLGSIAVALSGCILGCGDDEEMMEVATTGELVLRGSSQPPPSPVAQPTTAASVPVGDPASFLVGLYSFHISGNADCSGPFITAFDNGSAAATRDLTTNPEFFTARDVATGTYPCVAMRISDIVSFQSESSGGACMAGVTYARDVYRAGGEAEPFLDLSLTPIPATGTDAIPSEDRIYILFTINRSAATGRGFAQNQVVALTSPLVVPSAMTFYWDATNAVQDNAGQCVLEPEALALFS